MNNDITFVSAYYKMYDTINTKYIDNFIKIVEKGNKMILFLDPKLGDIKKRLEIYQNLFIINDIQFEDLPITKLFSKNVSLPNNRNINKDTRDFLILMNNKIEFMKYSLIYIETKYIAWIDFGIMKIFKDFDVNWKNITNIKILDDKLLIPGCHNKKLLNDLDNVNWRFCGGLLFGTIKTITNFQELLYKYIEQHRDKITWEVNYWAIIEENNKNLIQWYWADHNDTMLNFPQKTN
jgi:hypothetical protein